MFKSIALPMVRGGRIKCMTPDEIKSFAEVSQSIQDKEGVSKKEADAMAAAAGRRDLGQAEMTRRSEEGRKESESKSAVTTQELEDTGGLVVGSELDMAIQDLSDVMSGLSTVDMDDVMKFIQSEIPKRATFKANSVKKSADTDVQNLDE